MRINALIRQASCLVCLISFLFGANNSLAQQQISFELPSTSDIVEPIYLFKFDKDRYYPVDSVNAKTSNPITFKVVEKSVRMYAIKCNSFPDIEFIVSKSDNEITISSTSQDWKNGNYKLSGTQENYCLSAIQKAEKQFQNQSSEWLTRKYQLDKFDPQLIHKHDSYDSLFNVSILEFNDKMDEISKYYPKTFCGSVLAKNSKLPSRFMTAEWAKQFDNDFAFWHQHYFHFLSFNEPELLNFPHLRISIDTYLKNYTSKSNEGLKYFVDLLFSRAMNDEVRTFLTDLYLQSFISQNNEEMVAYLLKTDDDNCEADIKPTGLIENLKKLTAGAKAPEIELIDIKGTQKKLSETCAANKLTALVFYSPTCPHCKELLQELKELKLYNPNLEIFTITGDNLESTRAFVEENELNWTNCIYEGPNSNPINPYNEYAVLKVPTLVLIDQDQTLITRFGTLDVLKTTLNQ